MKLLIFAGSIRLNSFNRKLAAVAAGLARASGAEVTHIELADFDIPMYNADLEARGTPPDVMKLKQLMHEHPAWTDEFKFSRGKVVGILSASPGALGGLRSQSHLAPLLLNVQCWVAPRNFALGRAGDAFGAQGQLLNDVHRQNVQAVIDQVLFAAGRLAA